MRRPTACAPLLVLFFAASAAAREAPTQDPDDAVFTATQVVIVSPGEPHKFKIERSYRGKLAVGSTIELPRFKLVTWTEHEGDEVPEGMSEDTRILLFLQPDAKNPDGLEVTGYGDAFFFRDVAAIDELHALAKSALAFHRQWQNARDLQDPQARIRALFPYLLRSTRSCKECTLQELAKLNPASGDYLASQLATVSLRDREGLLLDIRQLPSPQAHAAAIEAVNHACTRFKIYLATHGLKRLDVIAHWKDAAGEVKDDYGIVYYGLAAINSFHDPADTPYLRGLVPFLLANGFQQAVEECVFAMKDHPSPENVPVLISIWGDYKAHHQPPADNDPLLPMQLAYAMALQNDFAVLPALFEMLDIPKWHDSALGALRDLTKKDIFNDAEWKAWYAAQPKRAEKTESKAP